LCELMWWIELFFFFFRACDFLMCLVVCDEIFLGTTRTEATEWLMR
jgi:hypothetical protein